MSAPDGTDRCWRCGSPFLTEHESVPVTRDGWVERRLICEDCGRKQYELGKGRGVL